MNFSRKPTLIPFVVAGHPTMGEAEWLIDAWARDGIECIELGVPYSDALADGPVIQAASEEAARRVRLSDVLALATRIRDKHPALKLVLFSYFNPLLRYRSPSGATGLDAFAADAVTAGASAVLVVDLPPEEAGPHLAACRRAGLETVFLASPTTPPERLPAVAEASTGFVYYVSRLGVTGESAGVSGTLAAEVARARAALGDRRLAVGFGVSTPAHAREVGRVADAVVVGSAFVRLMGKPGGVGEARELARAMVAALEAGR